MNKEVIEQIILNFHNEYLPNVVLSLSKRPNDNVNIYIEKLNDVYILGANLNTLEKLNLERKELIGLLFHEKGHLDLGHLDDDDRIDINIILLLMSFMLFIVTAIINIFFNINLLTSMLGIFSLILSIQLCKILKQRQKKELEADLYASNFCNKKILKNLFIKLTKFYKLEKKEFILLSTHPSLKDRLKNLN